MTQSDRPRGRPRDPAARAAILDAAVRLLDEGGLSAVTIEAVARLAGVGKPTIYRHWSNAHAVAMAAFLERAAANPASNPEARSEEPLAMLRRQVANLALAFTARTGRNLRAMIAAAERETELAKAFRSHVMGTSRQEGRALLELAITQASLRPDIDLEIALDLIYGPLYYRLLVGHAPLDAVFTNSLLDHVLAGLAVVRERR